MPDQASQGSPGGPHRKATGFVAKARAHKALTATIAVAGFLGLGGIFGQWAVERIGDLLSGESAPAGFEQLHAKWQDTTKLSERLVKTTTKANRTLVRGADPRAQQPRLSFAVDLAGYRTGLLHIRRDASMLAGRIRAISTGVPGARADLVQLVILVRRTAGLVKTRIEEAHATYEGKPIDPGLGNYTPITNDELQDAVSAQDDLVTQLAASLGPIARRFERPIPTIHGWNRLVHYEASSDKPGL